MATTTKMLARTGASTTVDTLLYTVPAATTTVITNIVIANTNASAVTATISLSKTVGMISSNIPLLSSIAIAANSIFAFDLKQVLPTAELIVGSASTSGVTFHISGVEIA
jgi:phage tail protein X